MKASDESKDSLMPVPTKSSHRQSKAKLDMPDNSEILADLLKLNQTVAQLHKNKVNNDEHEVTVFNINERIDSLEKST